MERFEALKQRIDQFTKDRNWDQFHTPVNLAKSISIEAAELLECFQWSNEEFDKMLEENSKGLSRNCQDLEQYVNQIRVLREELINRGEKDPFLPYGKNILPNDEDIEKAKKVANVLQECVDIADGDADVFTNELQRRMVDPILPRKNFRR